MSPAGLSLPSPGVGSRRKSFPKLPSSAFTPTFGAGSGIPEAPDPSTIKPSSVIDAAFGSSGDASPNLAGAVLSASDPSAISATISRSASVKPIALSVPVTAFTEINSSKTSHGAPIAFVTTVSKSTASQQVDTLASALGAGHVVELVIEGSAASDDAEGYGFVADLIEKAQAHNEKAITAPIVIGNVLPPFSDLEISPAKLLSTPSFLAYADQMASLSLLPSTYVKFVPPKWKTDGTPISSSQAKEWKKRVKMYLGPAIAAFGVGRVIYGSSSSGPEPTSVPYATWLELSIESLVETIEDVQQEDVDAVMGGNALKVYSK